MSPREKAIERMRWYSGPRFGKDHEGNIVYRSTRLGIEVIAVGETPRGAEVIACALNYQSGLTDRPLFNGLLEPKLLGSLEDIK